MNLLLTGGAGYVGWSVASALSKSASVQHVVIYDNFFRQNFGVLISLKDKGLQSCRVVMDDVLNSRGVEEALESIDCVCHLAALAPSSFRDDNPHFFDQVNHWGTAEITQAAQKAGVKKFVYVSSGAVYGFGADVKSYKYDAYPVTAYGVSKLAGERHVSRLSSELETYIIRAGTVYGLNPAARFDTFVNKFALDVALGRALQVHGSGEQKRPLIHLQDVVNIVVAAVEGRLAPGIYDAVTENLSVNDVVEVARAANRNFDVIFMNQQQAMQQLKIKPDRRLESITTAGLTVKKTFASILDAITLGQSFKTSSK